jgi:hypothetical protein
MTHDHFVRELAPLVRAALALGPLNVSGLHRDLRQRTRLRIPPRHLLVSYCAQLPDVQVHRAVDHQACRISAQLHLVDDRHIPQAVHS